MIICTVIRSRIQGLPDIRDICRKEKETLWEENKRFVNPAKVYVDLSDQLYALKQKVFNELSSVKYNG